VALNRAKRGNKIRILAVVLCLALLYILVVNVNHTLTGTNRWDGIIGVLLGLYVCSHPAANFVDILFFGHTSLFQDLSGRMKNLWLGVNLVVMLVGWVVIDLGMIRFTAR
jgi:hypothetical protein